MDFSGINSAYSDYYMDAAKNAASADLSEKLKNAASEAATDEELMGVCKQFESYMLEQVMKQMQKTATVFGEETSDTTPLVGFFKEQTIQEVAKQSTETNSLGIAQMLYEQLRVNMGLAKDMITPEQLAARAEAAEQIASAAEPSAEEIAQNAAASGAVAES